MHPITTFDSGVTANIGDTDKTSTTKASAAIGSRKSQRTNTKNPVLFTWKPANRYSTIKKRRVIRTRKGKSIRKLENRDDNGPTVPFDLSLEKVAYSVR